MVVSTPVKPWETRTIGSLVDRQPLATVRTTSTNWKTGPKQGRGSLTPTLAPECQLGVSFFALCFLPPSPHAHRLPRESPAQALQPHDLGLRMFFEALSIPFAPSTTSRLTADFSAAIGTLHLSGGEKEAPVSRPRAWRGARVGAVWQGWLPREQCLRGLAARFCRLRSSSVLAASCSGQWA